MATERLGEETVITSMRNSLSEDTPFNCQCASEEISLHSVAGPKTGIEM